MISRTLALILGLSCVLFAQSDRATLTGTISDPSQAAVQGAAVTLNAVETGVQRVATTNAVGVYVFSSLPLGRYKASVTASGFQKLEFEPFDLQVGETRTLNATLPLASLGATIQVTAAADYLNRATAEVGGVVNGAQLNDLPMNGRSFERLESLVPGAIDDASSTEDQIRFVGLSQEDNNFQMDGVDATGINHQFEKVDLRLQLPVEAIAEFKASSAVYSADQGGSAGGQIQVVSKSGTNTYHGSAWEFVRNSMFDARSWNSTGLPQLQLNNFGANLGGPAKKNKLFFFANWESYRQVLAQQVTGFIPSPSFRAATTAASPSLAPIINSYVNGGTPTSDPNAYSYSGSGHNPVQEDSGMARIDYQLSENTNLFGRISTDHYNNTFPNGIEVNSNGQLSTQFNSLTAPNAVVGMTHVFSADIFTDVRVGFNRDEYHEGGDQIMPVNFSVTGLSTLNTPATDDRYDTSYSIVDDTTFVSGRHRFKAGLLVRRVQEDKNTPKIPVITATYLSESAFEANSLDSYAYQGFSTMTGQRQTEYGAYVLDEIRLKPNLTINAGLRYDYWSVDHDVFGRGVVVDPATCPGLVCPPGSSWYFPDRTDLGPRLAIAWSPQAMHNKTVIRVGSGIFYGQGQFGHLGQPVGNIPQNFTLLQTSIPQLSYPVTPFLSAAAYSVSYTAQYRYRKNLAVDEWSASIQQEIAKDTTLTVSYIGSEGSHLWTNSIANGYNTVLGARPFAGFSNINFYTTNGVSNYNALEMGVHRSLSTGLLVAANYQWSHAIDDGAVGGAEASTPEDQNCRTCERASSQFDMRQYFTSSAIWQIPVGRGRSVLGNANPVANAILGGWQLAGVGTVRSGLPLNVTISRSGSALPDLINSSQRPNVVPGVPLYPSDQTPSDWLNPAAFSAPANDIWGNAGRDLLRAPGHWQMDMALEKRVRAMEHLAFTFRAEAFNLFNVAQYGSPVVSLSEKTVNGQVVVSPGTYGVINGAFSTTPTGSGTPREIELSLRLDF